MIDDHEPICVINIHTYNRNVKLYLYSSLTGKICGFIKTLCLHFTGRLCIFEKLYSILIKHAGK